MYTYDDVAMFRLLKKKHIAENGCWEWTGSLDNGGYGIIKYCESVWRVHRLMLYLTRPKEFNLYPVVMHLCDNRKCFNPEHIKGGTDSDNVRDMVAKGRLNRQTTVITHCKRGHEYTDENTYYDKIGKRSCRICRAEVKKQIKERR